MIPAGANLISGEFNVQQIVERGKDKGELNITITSKTKGRDMTKKALSRAGLEPGDQKTGPANYHFF